MSIKIPVLCLFSTFYIYVYQNSGDMLFFFSAKLLYTLSIKISVIYVFFRWDFCILMSIRIPVISLFFLQDFCIFTSIRVPESLARMWKNKNLKRVSRIRRTDSYSLCPGFVLFSFPSFYLRITQPLRSLLGFVFWQQCDTSF